MLDAGEPFVLLDVREVEEHQVANIPQAKLVPLSTFTTQLPRLLEHADDKIIVHCHHGQRSFNAAAFLRQQGFEDVKSMAGGIDAWSLEIDSAVPRY
jgi:rhodanese-related sulfurtransferase